jgi:hypothetical protein
MWVPQNVFDDWTIIRDLSLLCSPNLSVWFLSQRKFKALSYKNNPGTWEALQIKIQNAIQQITEHKLQYVPQNFVIVKYASVLEDNTFNN